VKAKRPRYVAGTYKSYFHDQPPFFYWNCERARPLVGEGA
jgi:hypothetical protein